MSFTIEDVVARGMCIGCGGCAVRTSGAVPVTIGRRSGMYQADLTGATDAQKRAASHVCPMSDDALDEDELASRRFAGMQHDAQIGHYLRAVAGRVTSDEAVVHSSSGGLTTYLLQALLERDEVDGIVHVGRSTGEGLFEYTVSSSVDELLDRRKSNYYSTTMADVLTSVRGDGKRYAVVGIPCFIKAARLLAESDDTLASQFAYFVGLLCGHLKSQFFAESLAWQAGVAPESLAAMDFRVKNPARDSNNYDYAATDTHSQRQVRRVKSAVDGNWGFAAFQPEGCNFCDDVFAETADVVLGDAWLPEYTQEWRGTNVVVVRNEIIADILAAGETAGALELDDLNPDRTAKTQAGNFRHRRAGMSVRLADDMAAGLRVPAKRFAPGYDTVTPRRVDVIRARRALSALSFDLFARAKATGDLSAYVAPMSRAIDKYLLVAAMDRGFKSYTKALLRSILRRR